MEEGVAPTDSRRRPDQRLMENGLFEDANAEKLRIEEKQRAVRKKRLASISTTKDGVSTATTTLVPAEVNRKFSSLSANLISKANEVQH
jgi:hypothetical protein